jgi:hypothetical protein
MIQTAPFIGRVPFFGAVGPPAVELTFGNIGTGDICPIA